MGQTEDGLHKKIIKKLQGADASTATWLTYVGNKRGEILKSVLTTSENFGRWTHSSSVLRKHGNPILMFIH